MFFWYVFCILLLLFPQPIPSALRGDPQKVRDKADTDRKEQGKETGAEEHHDSPACSAGSDSTEESTETTEKEDIPTDVGIDTGDDSNMLVYLVVASLSGAAVVIALIIVRYKRRR